jgi:hypothetical protein
MPTFINQPTWRSRWFPKKLSYSLEVVPLISMSKTIVSQAQEEIGKLSKTRETNSSSPVSSWFLGTAFAWSISNLHKQSFSRSTVPLMEVAFHTTYGPIFSFLFFSFSFRSFNAELLTPQPKVTVVRVTLGHLVWLSGEVETRKRKVEDGFGWQYCSFKIY